MDACALALLLVAAAPVINALTCPGICPNNATMGLPNRAYNWSVLSETFTCADWDEDSRLPYLNADGKEVCSADDDAKFWIDMASYCGCENYTQALTCDFCPSGNIVNPDTLIVAPEGSDLEFSLTCEQAAVATQFVSNENTCFSLKLLFAPSCCQEGQGATGANSSSSSSSSSSSQCSICPPGSTMQKPDQSLFFIGEGLTCQSGQGILDGIDSEADCSLARERFDRLPVDVAAWCGCSGVAPSNSCPFCSRTSDGALLNEDREVAIGNNLTVTCAEASDLAPFVNDASACGREIELAIRDCCSGVPTAAFPSLVPTFQPTYYSATSAGPGTDRARRTPSLRGWTASLSPFLGLWWMIVVCL